MASVRLFVAIETPPEIRELISGIIDELRKIPSSVRWEHPAKLHATLKFLGETPEEKIPAIKDVLGRLTRDGTEPFPVQYSNPDVFPDRHRPRVLWIGIDDPTGSMKELHRSADGLLASIGFEREKRAFHPHVTIGRVKGGKASEPLLAKLETVTLDTDQVRIGEFVLMRSHLGPAGSRYSLLERFPFDGKHSDSAS